MSFVHLRMMNFSGEAAFRKIASSDFTLVIT